MTTILIFVLFNCIAILAFNRASEFDYLDSDYPHLGIMKGSKMIFWKLRHWSLQTLGEFWSKPVCTCPLCMGSLHSTYFFAFYWLKYSGDPAMLWFFPMYALVVAGCSYLLNLIALKLEN